MGTRQWRGPWCASIAKRVIVNLRLSGTNTRHITTTAMDIITGPAARAKAALPLAKLVSPMAKLARLNQRLRRATAGTDVAGGVLVKKYFNKGD